MTAFILQLIALLNNGYVQTFFVFFVVINVFYWLRVWVASRNKPYTEPFEGKYSVIVTVFREDPELFEKCLKSITDYSSPTELIVSIDDVSHANKKDIAIATKYATKVLRMPEHVGKREQYYQASQALSKKVDVVLTVDSDTIWDETTINILKPFNDERVGAVSGRQIIFDADANWIRRIAEWFEDMRFTVQLPFQSYFGQVNVIPGRTLAARAEEFKEIAEQIRHETFMGRELVTSDDASITMSFLERGFRTVYQADSLVMTDAPSTFKGFWKQYLRWYRGSVRRFFHKFTTLVRLNPLVFLASVEFIFGTFMYAAIVLNFIFKLNFRLFEVLPVDGFALTESFNIGFILLLVLGYFVSSLIRNLPHLVHNKRDVLFLPVFAIFNLIIMFPLKTVALFTFFENSWMTRHHGKRSIVKRNLMLTRLFAGVLGAAILLAALPLPYLFDTRPLDVPFATVLHKDAPEYYKAREILASYANADSKDDVSLQRVEHLFEQYDKRHGNEKVAIADSAQCFVADAKAKKLDASQPLDAAAKCRDAQYVATVLKPTTVSAAPVQDTVLAAKEDKTPQGVMPAQDIQITIGDNDNATYAVRRAIAGIDTQHALTPTQVAYIEAQYVTLRELSDAVSPGQVLSISRDAVQKLIAQAQSLSAMDQAAWQPYGSMILY